MRLLLWLLSHLHKRRLGCARKLGFSEVKRRKDAYVVDGVEYDELLLEKRFDD